VNAVHLVGNIGQEIEVREFAARDGGEVKVNGSEPRGCLKMPVHAGALVWLAPPTPDNQVFRHVFCIDTETNSALDPSQ
jgi:hypothetical protein